MKVNSINQCYYSNFANLHIFNLSDMGNFGSWMCKIDIFFYFALVRASTSMDVKFCKKNILFFFFYTPIFTKHAHQCVYSTHLFNKIFIFTLLSGTLSQTQHNLSHHQWSIHTHHQPTQPPSLTQHHHQSPSSSTITHWSNKE